MTPKGHFEIKAQSFYFGIIIKTILQIRHKILAQIFLQLALLPPLGHKEAIKTSVQMNL